MLKDFKIIKLVRAKSVARATFFRFIYRKIVKLLVFFQLTIILLKMFMFMGSQWNFCPVDILALKAEESCRMAQHAHGLFCS
jgi:hypothetical protein